MADFLEVTELRGDWVSKEQLERLCNRYYWAGKYCFSKDVLEVGCGAGLGLGYLAELSKSICAGDCSAQILRIAMEHYGDRIPLQQFNAQDIPCQDNSKDVIILFEAIYYLASAEEFVKECRRVLRNGGKVLITTANKDLYDFNPSPYSNRYYGVVEMDNLFNKYGFSTRFYGDIPVDSLSVRQKIFRPVKKMAVKLGLIPKSMNGKKFLKRLVFGQMVKMPAEIRKGMVPHIKPVELLSKLPDRKYKVIYCVGTLKKD